MNFIESGPPLRAFGRLPTSLLNGTGRAAGSFFLSILCPGGDPVSRTLIVCAVLAVAPLPCRAEPPGPSAETPIRLTVVRRPPAAEPPALRYLLFARPQGE